MVMYANEVETKEKEKLPEIKKLLQHVHVNTTSQKQIMSKQKYQYVNWTA